MEKPEDIVLEQKEEKHKTKELRKIFEEVFDNRTIEAIKKLTKKGSFDKIEHIISTGKEGNIFKGKKENEDCAIKIYRIETSSFDNMLKYIENDYRFKAIRHNKQNLIYEWTKKEFKNLSLAEKNGVNVPYPIAYFKNVLVMEFLGEKEAHKTLKDEKLSKKDQGEVFKQTIKNLHNLIYKARLVHADLSEYNIIYLKKKLYFIDMGQAVPLGHPKAKEFYNRDIVNLTRYFSKQGIKISESELKERIKKGE